jgi:cysteine desulfurase
MGHRTPIYLDAHATTPVDERVLAAMLPYFAERFGNAASKQHVYGWEAEAAVEGARSDVATLVGASSREIVFTSGATESINLALKGVAEGSNGGGREIITVATEHRAVLDTCRTLERRGWTVRILPVDRYGRIALEELSAALTERTVLVSVMLANNEIGTMQDLRAISRLCRARGVLLHSDATQAVGNIPVDVNVLGVDLMSFSAHKMYGPKGTGALYVRETSPRMRIQAQIDGGGHERGLRSGTSNVPAIVGFGSAARIAREYLAHEPPRVRDLRNQFVALMEALLGDVIVNGHPEFRLPNNANLTFPGTRADGLMMDMKDVAVSAGSACSSSAPEPSHVLRAIGLRSELARATLRFGLGRFTTEEDVVYAAGRVAEVVQQQRERRTAGVPA